MKWLLLSFFLFSAVDRSVAADATLSILDPAAPPDDLPDYQANPSLIDLDGYVIFFNATGPLSFVTATPRDVPPDAQRLGRVHAEACEHGLSLPFTANLTDQSAKIAGAYGEGGYEKALEKIRKNNPAIEGVYDIQVDQHDIRILTIYSRHCTEVTALAFRQP